MVSILDMIAICSRFYSPGGLLVVPVRAMDSFWPGVSLFGAVGSL